MINLLPEPKQLKDLGGLTKPFSQIFFEADAGVDTEALADIAKLRFWNYPKLTFCHCCEPCEDCIPMRAVPSLSGVTADNAELFKAQGYQLSIAPDGITLKYGTKAGFINGVTSLKMLLREADGGYRLPLCEITDWPSLPVRAVAPTFSWYAGYGRIGFDCQLWGYEQWVEFINVCLDNKINQMNMVMYGYWPFEMEQYPETVLRNVPIQIWNAENRMWLTVRYTHPNLEKPYLAKLIQYAHSLEFKLFAYVVLI